jgi:uncharacterized alkaline shock family protein YloU
VTNAATAETDVADSSARGTLIVAERAVQRLVLKAALDTPGVQRHSRGLSKLATQSLPHAQLDIMGNRVHVRLNIAIAWPTPIVDVSRAVQRNVADSLRTLAGFDITVVDISVSHLSATSNQPTRLQ